MRHNKCVIYVYNLYKGASPVTGPAVKGILHSALFCIVMFTKLILNYVNYSLENL